MENVWVDFKTLKSFMIDVFKEVGVPENDAETCAEILITADKYGIDSHGVGRFKPIYIDRILAGIQQPKTQIEVIKETPTTAVLDGHHGMGHVIGYKAMEMAIEKAKKFGMGMTAVRNSTHYGIAGYYPLMAAEAGMIGMTGTNARPSIAPTFGVENMLGTNPLTLGAPTDEAFPFLLDCATSVSQRGKIEVYSREGKSLPLGWVIGRDGESRSDTDQILVDLTQGNAALAPLGGLGEETAGYKGYGYATFVEILSAALQGGQFLKALSGFDQKGQRQPYGLGHFFIAIQVEAFTELENFKKITGEILRSLRQSQKAPGQDRIYTAWEKEYENFLYRKDKGAPLGQVLQEQLSELKNRYKLDQYQFPWE